VIPRPLTSEGVWRSRCSCSGSDDPWRVGLQEILDKGNKGKDGGGGDGEADLKEALTSQVRVMSLSCSSHD